MKNVSSATKMPKETNVPTARNVHLKERFFENYAVKDHSFFKPANLQPKLKIGQAGDKYEREADRVADNVINTPDIAIQRHDVDEIENHMKAEPGVQMMCDGCREEEEVQRKPLIRLKAESSPAAPPEMSLGINSVKSTGKSLPENTAQEMGFKIGADFKRVRIHTDSQAVQLNRQLGARAFTTGKNIFFNRGEYSPDTINGKRLLAHELVHTVQQGYSTAVIQRTCDPTVLTARTTPRYFPSETELIRVYNGYGTIRRSQTPKMSVALIQQALVDLGYFLGNFGPNNDGVDHYLGPYTETAITSFQSNESIASGNSGVIDQVTLRCLDEKRSNFRVQPQQTGTITESDFLIENEYEESNGRDEDIFFERGSTVISEPGKRKINELLLRQSNSLLTSSAMLYGFISEDELVDFGETLATNRILAVENEINSQRRNMGLAGLVASLLPMISYRPLPLESIGISNYRARRKVEIVFQGSQSATASCPVGSEKYQQLNQSEAATLNSDINTALRWMDMAVTSIRSDTTEARSAIASYFGTTVQRQIVLQKLVTWRSYLNSTIRNRNRMGTECNDTCRFAIAYMDRQGPNGTMTLCPEFFTGFSGYDQLNHDELRALVIMHEAGHGALGVIDYAYGHRRLIEFLHQYPQIALENTDSYVLMVLCLSNIGDFCTPPSATDSYIGLNSSEEEEARRGVAWLQSWLTWTNIDTSNLYRKMNLSRNSGDGLQHISNYSARIYDLLANSFNVHRPPNDPPVTFSEQIVVSAILDRLKIMGRATNQNLTYIKETPQVFPDFWQSGPGDHLNLTTAYFSLISDRSRVEFLLPLLIEATPQISISLQRAYENYIKDFIRIGRWQNQP
jgi:peptidoglycan hydrolase-like protein with peptidoglycan-binding domain